MKTETTKPRCNVMLDVIEMQARRTSAVRCALRQSLEVNRAVARHLGEKANRTATETSLYQRVLAAIEVGETSR